MDVKISKYITNSAVTNASVLFHLGVSTYLEIFFEKIPLSKWNNTMTVEVYTASLCTINRKQAGLM